MKIGISDTHDSHGIMFTLGLDTEEGNQQDQKVMEFLHKHLDSVHKETEGLKESALRTYGLVLRQNGCDFQFTEAGKWLAKVDGLWNSRRKDQKFVVLIVEGEDYLHYENVHEIAAKLHEVCYYCGKTAYIVGRRAVTIYDISCDPPQERLVIVHDQCEKQRQIKIAKLFPY